MSLRGLGIPHKLNRPLKDLEKKLQLHQGKPRRVKYITGTKSVIRMNSTDLEVVDSFYEEGGLGVVNFAFYFFLCFASTIFFAYIITIPTLLTSNDPVMMFSFIFINLVFLLMAIIFGYFVSQIWFKWTHYPIRFNRKNKNVYIFQPGGSVLTLPWQDIYFTREKDFFGWMIYGHQLAQDNETVLATFSFGYRYHKQDIVEYWEFIRRYMEEDVVPQLADLVIFCPPIADRKEGAVFGLQYLFYMQSRLVWLFLPIKSIYILLSFPGSYITSLTGKIPQWPKEVLDACQPDADDPIDVSAANNPENMWRLVFANESIWTWARRYRRMNNATNQIYDALEKRYGDAYRKQKRLTLKDSMKDYVGHTPKKDAQRKKKPQK